MAASIVPIEIKHRDGRLEGAHFLIGSTCYVVVSRCSNDHMIAVELNDMKRGLAKLYIVPLPMDVSAFAFHRVDPQEIKRHTDGIPSY